MVVTVKLFATLRRDRFDVDRLTLPAGTDVGSVILDLGIPEEDLGIVLVNGRHVGMDRRLAEGDTLAVFPLVGGG